MNNGFEYIDIILLGMIAAFIVLRLRGTLGRRTGHQDKNINGRINKGSIQNINESTKVNIDAKNFNDEAKAEFINGAKIAYETIVTSLAKGDKISLKPLFVTSGKTKVTSSSTSLALAFRLLVVSLPTSITILQQIMIAII